MDLRSSAILELMKISIIAHPNAKRPRIETDLLETIHVYVNQPPLEDKANKAIVAALAAYYKQPKSAIRLVAGQKSKLKTFEINK